MFWLRHLFSNSQLQSVRTEEKKTSLKEIYSVKLHAIFNNFLHETSANNVDVYFKKILKNSHILIARADYY